MYEHYFGLKRAPFKISPDTSLFFEGGKRADILDALVYAIHRGEGIIKVVGEVGSGKTMLCRMLQLKLPESVEIIYIGNPSVSAEDILFVIAHELTLAVRKDASKHEIIHMLQNYLLQKHIEGRQVVLFIEEAQGMPLDTLEEIRLLSNLETDQHKLLQIILFGQPELDDNLSQQKIRQLRERITNNFDLSPLTTDEVHQYLNFRMRQVGYTGPELISASLAKKVARYSGGLLRRINIIADKILLSAYAESTHDLTTRHLVAAVNDSAFAKTGSRYNKTTIWPLAMLVLMALAFVIYKIGHPWAGAQARAGTNSEVMSAAKQKPAAEQNNDAMDTGKASVETSAPPRDRIRGILPAAVDRDKPVAAAGLELAETGSYQTHVAGTGSNSEIAADLVDQARNKPLKPAIELSKNGSAEAKSSRDQPGDSWLETRLRHSRDWLTRADTTKLSIQVMMRRKSSETELSYYLQNVWPLSLEKTYLYEVNMSSGTTYRVFYGEYESVARGRQAIKGLPESVKRNSPYLHSVRQMQEALLQPDQMGQGKLQ